MGQPLPDRADPFRQWQPPPCPQPRLRAHRIHRSPVPPPSATALCGYKGSGLPMSSPFSTSVFRSCPASVFSFRYADADCRTPVHRAPPPPSTTLLDRRLLELHPALVHLYNPSSSSPDIPSGPSSLLLPARCAPPRTTRSSLCSVDSTTPRAPCRRVRPPRTVSHRPPPPDTTPIPVPLRPTTHHHRAHSSCEDLPDSTPQMGVLHCRATLAPLLHRPRCPQAGAGRATASAAVG
jgi:hypothetical protein